MSRAPIYISQQEQDELVARARLALECAYSPYSRFRVGAALRASDGRVYGGCNVENASYGLTICAERTAVQKAVSEGVRDFDAIAVVTESATTAMPCGACRQVLAEFAEHLVVIVENANAQRVVCTIADLLPRSFRPSDLGEA